MEPDFVKKKSPYQGVAVSVIICLLSILVYTFVLPVSVRKNEIPPRAVILICGASRGIGEELAYQAAEKGANLVLVARSEDKLLRVQEQALKKGATAVEIIPFDFSDVAGSSIVVNKTVNRFGKLDFLVLNHAAMTFGPFLAAKNMHDPVYVDRIFRINTFSNIEIVLHALPHLERSSGHIFITSSTFGELPFNYEMALYSASKHALNGFFYSLQMELLAKESPASLTIGALGLIWTSDMENLFKNDSIPVNIFTGSTKGCAQGILEAYITRPRTWTYPRFANNFCRTMWSFNPWYQEMTIKQYQVPKSKGYGYNEKVSEWNKKIAAAAEKKFQSGYNVKLTNSPNE